MRAPYHIGQTVRVACWIDGRIQPVRVEFTRLDDERVRLQAVSARPLGDVPTVSYGRRYCVVMGEAEWRARPDSLVGTGPGSHAYHRELANWALGKLNITAANAEQGGAA